MISEKECFTYQDFGPRLPFRTHTGMATASTGHDLPEQMQWKLQMHFSLAEWLRTVGSSIRLSAYKMGYSSILQSGCLKRFPSVSV